MRQSGLGSNPSLRGLLTIITNRKLDLTANEINYSSGKAVPRASNFELLKKFIRSQALNKLDHAVRRNRRSGTIYDMTAGDIDKIEQQLLKTMNDVAKASL